MGLKFLSSGIPAPADTRLSPDERTALEVAHPASRIPSRSQPVAGPEDMGLTSAAPLGLPISYFPFFFRGGIMISTQQPPVIFLGQKGMSVTQLSALCFTLVVIV